MVITGIALVLLFMAHALRQSPAPVFADHSVGTGVWFYLAVIFAPLVFVAALGRALDNVLGPRR